MVYLPHRQFIRRRGLPRGANRGRKGRDKYWGIDMTKYIISSIGWVYLVIVLDWYTQKVVGWKLALRSRSSEWKEGSPESQRLFVKENRTVPFLFFYALSCETLPFYFLYLHIILGLTFSFMFLLHLEKFYIAIYDLSSKI